MSASASRSGFTLVELVLTVVLLLLLLGAVVFNFGSLQSKSDLEEGGRQVEALIHFARAQSLAYGKKVELRFSDGDESSSLTGSAQPHENSTPAPASNVPDKAPFSPEPASSPKSGRRFVLGIEDDPVRAPGTFSRLAGADNFIEAIEDRVTLTELIRQEQDLLPPNLNPPAAVQSSEELGSFDARIIPGAKIALPQDSVKSSLLRPQESPQEPQHFIYFYPDGTSDDAELVLASVSSDDHRRIRIRLRGNSGTLSRDIETPPETELLSEDNAPAAEAVSGSGGSR